MNIEELKRLAEAATPGPWNLALWTTGHRCAEVMTAHNHRIVRDATVENSAFIAAANPAAMLELIRQRDEYQRQAEGIASEFNMIERERDEWKARYEFSVTVRNSLQQQRDELLAALNYARRELAYAGRQEAHDAVFAVVAKAEK